jgi:hypothetical protein
MTELDKLIGEMRKQGWHDGAERTGNRWELQRKALAALECLRDYDNLPVLDRGSRR